MVHTSGGCVGRYRSSVLARSCLSGGGRIKTQGTVRREKEIAEQVALAVVHALSRFSGLLLVVPVAKELFVSETSSGAAEEIVWRGTSSQWKNFGVYLLCGLFAGSSCLFFSRWPIISKQ